MGQKVHPNAFRRNVPYWGRDSYRFQQGNLNYELNRVNHSGTKDRWGQSVTRTGELTSREYGAWSTYLEQRSRVVDEVLVEHRLVRNRCSAHLMKSGGEMISQVVLQIEWFPVKGFELTVEEKDALSDSWRMRSNWAEQSAPGPVRVQCVDLDLLTWAKSHLEWEARRHSMREEMELLSEEAEYREKGQRATKEVSALANSVREKSSQMQSIMQSSQERVLLGYRKQFRKERIESWGGRGTQTALVTLLRMAGIRPVVPALNRRMVMYREDSTGQMEAFGMRKELMDMVSQSPYGLIQPGMGSASERSPENLRNERQELDKNNQFLGGYRGCRRKVKGRRDGSRRTKAEVFQLGILPLSTCSAPRIQSHEVAKTKYGTRGVELIYSY